MPKALHAKLARQAKKKGVRDKGAYIYGTLNRVEKAKKAKRSRKAVKKKR